MKIKVPAPTLLDRAISYVSPQRGLQRLHARTMQEMALGGAYSSGTTVTNPRNWRAVPRSALTDQAGELYDMRGRSRELARLSPIAIGAINTNVDRVVGTGLALSAMPNRRVLGWSEQQLNDWKARTQDEFAMWADSASSCDLTEVQNFDQLQALVLRSTLESGDCFSNLPDAPNPTRMRPTACACRCWRPTAWATLVGSLTPMRWPVASAWTATAAPWPATCTTAILAACNLWATAGRGNGWICWAPVAAAACCTTMTACGLSSL